jgi:hypothetical protein
MLLTLRAFPLSIVSCLLANECRYSLSHDLWLQ